MKYTIEISKTAEKQLKKIPKEYQGRIVNSILSLGNNPYPYGYKKLSGFDDVYRVRVADYRIVYSVEDKRLVIIVLKLGHRKDIYR